MKARLASRTASVRERRAQANDAPRFEVPEDLGLTPRELEIARLLCGGLAPKEIALKLDRSVKTVRAHIHSLHRRLRVQSTVDLVIQYGPRLRKID